MIGVKMRQNNICDETRAKSSLVKPTDWITGTINKDLLLT